MILSGPLRDKGQLCFFSKQYKGVRKSQISLRWLSEEPKNLMLLQVDREDSDQTADGQIDLSL